MNQQQLGQIVSFCKPYYKATGRWHAWDHISAVRSLVLAIAKAEFPMANTRCLEAAAIIHDMGRIIKDEGHAEESGRIAKPFLLAINVPSADIDVILDAVTHHDVKKIDQSRTLEARILFDADKIEILSVYGFLRVAYWLVEERQMELGKAINFLWDYCQKFQTKLYSDYAKDTLKPSLKLLSQLVDDFNVYQQQWRSKKNL